MSEQYRFNGAEGKGFMKTLKEIKRNDAEARNVNTPPERTAAYRREQTQKQKEASRAAAHKARGDKRMKEKVDELREKHNGRK